MIRLADFDVYATDEGLFVVGDSETATKIAGPQTPTHMVAPELVEAWNDVRGDAGSLPPVEAKKRTTGRTGASKSTGDYDLGSSSESEGLIRSDETEVSPTSEKTTTGSKSHGDYDPTEDKCKDCDGSNLFLSEGCSTCQDCGWSKCS